MLLEADLQELVKFRGTQAYNSLGILIDLLRAKALDRLENGETIEEFKHAQGYLLGLTRLRKMLNKPMEIVKTTKPIEEEEDKYNYGIG